MQEMEKALLGKKTACKGLKGQEECGQNETFRVAAHACRDGGVVEAIIRDRGWKDWGLICCNKAFGLYPRDHKSVQERE